MKGLRILPYVDAVPLGFSPSELNKAVYSMFTGDDPHAALESPEKRILDNCLLGDEPDVLDAVTMTYGRADSKMKALQRALNTAMVKGASKITVDDMEVGKPRKNGLTASVSVRFTFSDAQTVTVIFHAPDGDPTKVTSDDMLISYRWMLNGRDVTAWMSPEKDDNKLVDISLATLGMRVSQLIEANSEKFTTRQASMKADKDALATAKENAINANNQIADLENSKEAAQAELDKINELAATTTAQKEKALVRNKMLTDKLDGLQQAVAEPEDDAVISTDVINLIAEYLEAAKAKGLHIHALAKILTDERLKGGNVNEAGPARELVAEQMAEYLVENNLGVLDDSGDGGKNVQVTLSMANDYGLMSDGNTSSGFFDSLSDKYKELEDSRLIALAQKGEDDEPKPEVVDKNGTGAMGSKLDLYESLGFKGIVKLIRAEIKRIYPQVKTSVKQDSFSGGQSIRVAIKDIPANDVLYSEEYVEHAKNGYEGGFFGKSRYMPYIEEMMDSIKKIGDQYRYDESDSSTDYFNTNFYYNVDIDSEFGRARMDEQLKAKHEALMVVKETAVPEKLRASMLAAVYKKTHADYKGKLDDGTKTVLMNRGGAASLVALDELTDDEIKDKLGKKGYEFFVPKLNKWAGRLQDGAELSQDEQFKLLTDSLNEADEMATTGEAWDELLTTLAKSY